MHVADTFDLVAPLLVTTAAARRLAGHIPAGTPRLTAPPRSRLDDPLKVYPGRGWGRSLRQGLDGAEKQRGC